MLCACAPRKTHKCRRFRNFDSSTFGSCGRARLVKSRSVVGLGFLIPRPPTQTVNPNAGLHTFDLNRIFMHLFPGKTCPTCNTYKPKNLHPKSLKSWTPNPNTANIDPEGQFSGKNHAFISRKNGLHLINSRPEWWKPQPLASSTRIQSLNPSPTP